LVEMKLIFVKRVFVFVKAKILQKMEI